MATATEFTRHTRSPYIEKIVRQYEKELGRKLTSWSERMEAIICGAFDYDDAVEVLEHCGQIGNMAEQAAFASVGAPHVSKKQVECWVEKTARFFAHLCNDPECGRSRHVLEQCARLVDAMEILFQDTETLRPF